jgi:hypothetical protein
MNLLGGKALDEALEVDRAPAVYALVDLADAVMRFHLEQHRTGPRTSTTRALATTVRPPGVGAR